MSRRNYLNAMQQVFYALLLTLSIVIVDTSGEPNDGPIVKVPKGSKPNRRKPSPPIPIPKRVKSSHSPGEYHFDSVKRGLSTPNKRAVTDKEHNNKVYSAPPLLTTANAHASPKREIDAADSLLKPRNLDLMTPKLAPLNVSQLMSKSFDPIKKRTRTKPKIGNAPDRTETPIETAVIFIPPPDEDHELSQETGPSERSRSINILSSLRLVPPNTPVISPEQHSLVPTQNIGPLELDPHENLQDENGIHFPPLSPETTDYYENLARERYNHSLNAIPCLHQKRLSIGRNIKVLEALLSNSKAVPTSASTIYATAQQEAYVMMDDLEVELQETEHELGEESAQLQVYGREVAMTTTD